MPIFGNKQRAARQEAFANAVKERQDRIEKGKNIWVGLKDRKAGQSAKLTGTEWGRLKAYFASLGQSPDLMVFWHIKDGQEVYDVERADVWDETLSS